MSKDNENVPMLNEGPSPDSKTRAFTPDQMVHCESCLRANPPNRINCLYCESRLTVQPAAIALKRPALRPLEKWEQGYNNILLPPPANLAESCLAELADFLRLEKEDLQRIVASQMPLPLARSSSKYESELIRQRLGAAQLPSLIVADAALGLEQSLKLRSLEFRGDGLDAYQSPQAQPQKILWGDFVLLTSGRITRKRVELTEERKRSENRVLEADQFFADENVVDIFAKHEAAPFRIASGSFDFSCLADRKRLVAQENMPILAEVIRAHAPGIVYDQTYNSLRKALDPVWRPDQQNQSTGWRRGRPGKYSIGSVRETSNESQFSRYSRLRYYLLTHKELSDTDA